MICCNLHRGRKAAIAIDCRGIHFLIKIFIDMENIALEKFNGFNLHTWKVKIQLQMMHKNFWGIVKGTEKAPTDPRKLIE